MNAFNLSSRPISQMYLWSKEKLTHTVRVSQGKLQYQNEMYEKDDNVIITASLPNEEFHGVVAEITPYEA